MPISSIDHSNIAARSASAVSSKGLEGQVLLVQQKENKNNIDHATTQAQSDNSFDRIKSLISGMDNND